jgi:hypothetical protein
MSAHSGDPAKDSASGNSSRLQPLVQLPFHLVGDLNRSDVSCLAHQVDNRPVFFALPQVINPQANGFMPFQPTRQQQRKKCSVPLSFALLRQNENVGISEAMVNGLIPI